MESLTEYMNEYKKQMEKGYIQKAYQGLMSYVMALRGYFQNKYPDYFLSGNIYYGYMDMTYFSFSPKTLKERNLKVAIVFIHETFSFEVWLSGYNRNVQKQYWSCSGKAVGINTHCASRQRRRFHLRAYLVENPDFSDTDKLTAEIERSVGVYCRYRGISVQKLI